MDVLRTVALDLACRDVRSPRVSPLAWRRTIGAVRRLRGGAPRRTPARGRRAAMVSG